MSIETGVVVFGFGGTDEKDAPTVRIIDADGVRWAARRDLIEVAKFFGMDVSVPRELIAAKSGKSVDEIHMQVSEFGTKLAGWHFQTMTVSQDAWTAMLSLHHVCEEGVREITKEMLNCNTSIPAQPAAKPPDYATKRSVTELWKAFDQLEKLVHARLMRLEVAAATKPQDGAVSQADLKHLRKFVSQGYALLKKAESGKDS